MNKVLLVGFLLAIATQSLGQGIVVQNSNPTSSIANRGSYIADSIFRIGTRDTVKPSWWNPAWSFNGALQIGLDGKPYYYFGGYWRGVGSGASVTSITQGYGMALSPNPIVSTGSVSVDTTAISTKANVNSLLSAKVPYVGATTNVNLGEFQATVGQVTLDQTPTQAAGVGVLRWNDSDGTADLGLKGGNVTLQIGQEEVVRVVNKTGANLLESQYHAVYVSGAQGQRLKVGSAIALADSTSAATIGLVTENINLNQEGFITTNGLVRDINTTGSLQGETWNDGDLLFLSGTTAGQITNVKPIAPTHTVIIGYVVYAHANNGKIFVKVDNGYELDELHNVRIVSAANNQGLFYDSVAKLWENKSISTVLGYTPANNATVVKYADTAAMLGGYLLKVDTASLSNRIDAAGNDWKLTGNAGTNASTDYVGTSDNVDVVLRRNNVEKLRIANAQISTADKLIIGTNSFTGGTFGLATNNFVIGSDAVALGANQWRTTAGSSMSESYLVGGSSVGSRTVVSNGRFENNAVGGYIFSENGSERLRMITGTGVMFNNISADYSLTYKGTTNANLFRINAATNNVGIGIASPNASSILDITSTTQGLGLPSMTTTQQNAIATPRTGLEIYNSTLTTPQFYNGSVWTGAWYKRGNSGTTAGTDFIGTTDNVDLVFKRSNTTSGWLNSALFNTSFGVGSLPTTATGGSNTALGFNALSGVTTGTFNIAIGRLAGTKLAASSNNIAIGYRTLGDAGAGHTGNENVTVGNNSMIFTTSALRNSGLGFQNMYNIITGSENTSVGWSSLGTLTTAINNTAIGSQSGASTNTNNNSYFGYAAGYAHLAGDNSIYIGSEAGFRSSGGDNVAIGKLAGGTLVNQVSGDSNVFLGSRAGSDYRMVAASKNVLIGYDAQTATFAGSNQLNLANVLWGSGCTGVKNNPAGSLSVGATSPNASAIFDIVSTTKGLGLPSMTTTQQNAIGTPRAGLVVYNSTLGFPTYYNGTTWGSFASGWGLTGNAGTSAATNFIGTTDDIDLMFRRNNISSGRISTNNTAFGNGAGAALTSGANNSLFGAGAGGKLTNPSQNTYFGFNAGSEVVSGFNNIYIGSQAGASAGHTSGNKNLVISHQGMVATNNGANQLNIGNVLWGVDCSATGTTAAGRLGVGTNAPNASALLDLTSTTQGFLPPRMTATQAAAIATPAEGLMVYVTNTGGVFTGKGWWGWNGAAWEKLNP
jgi:hypothetical protein